jgi:hypothetical protein
VTRLAAAAVAAALTLALSTTASLAGDVRHGRELDPRGVRGELAGGLGLPADHRYEVYDPTTTGYLPIDVGQVPWRIAQDHWVYDRTARAWINHPSLGGLNPRYAAGALARGESPRPPSSFGPPAFAPARGDWRSDRDVERRLVAGPWSLPVDHRYETYDASAARYVAVDVTTVGPRLGRGEWIYDRTADAWVAHPTTGVNRDYLAATPHRPGWRR